MQQTFEGCTSFAILGADSVELTVTLCSDQHPKCRSQKVNPDALPTSSRERRTPAFARIYTRSRKGPFNDDKKSDNAANR